MWHFLLTVILLKEVCSTEKEKAGRKCNSVLKTSENCSFKMSVLSFRLKSIICYLLDLGSWIKKYCKSNKGNHFT